MISFPVGPRTVEVVEEIVSTTARLEALYGTPPASWPAVYLRDRQPPAYEIYQRAAEDAMGLIETGPTWETVLCHLLWDALDAAYNDTAQLRDKLIKLGAGAAALADLLGTEATTNDGGEAER